MAEDGNLPIPGRRVLEGEVLPPLSAPEPDGALLYQPSPFRFERIETVALAGQTIAQIVAGLGIPSTVHGLVTVHIGDVEVSRVHWHRVRAKTGMPIYVHVRMQGGEGGKDFFRVLAMFAVAVFAFWAGGVVAGLLGSVAGSFATAAVMTLGQYLVMALLPPPSVKTGYTFDQQIGNPYGQITGLRNQAAPYGPIPRVFGKRRLFPMLAARPYTETVGDNQYLRLLLLVGLGPLQITDIKFGETDIDAIAHCDYEVREGWAGDADVTLYERNIKEDSYGVLFDVAGTETIKTTRTGTKEISIDMVAPAGIAVFNDEGKPQTFTVSLNVRYRAAGTSDAWLSPDWLEPSSENGTNVDGVLSFSGKTQNAIRRTGRWTVPTGQYEVKITRTTAHSSSKEVDTVYLSTVRSVVAGDFMPMEGLSLIAIKVRATAQMNGVPDQINCIAESYLPVYDDGWTYEVSRNPAWAYADILRRRGLDTVLDDDRIDLTGISAWAAACDAARANDPGNPSWTFDAVMEGGAIFTAMRQIASHGRATFTHKDGKYSIARDVSTSTPVQHISPRNSWGYQGSKTFVDMPHALRVRFVNEEKFYQEDEVVVYDDGYSADGTGGTIAATKFETLDLPACTRPKQAWADGRYHMAVGKYRNEQHAVSMDIESLRCTIGDFVRFSHDVIAVGLGSGRIKALTLNGSSQVTAIQLDGVMSVESGVVYAIRCRKADLTSVLITLPAAGATTETDTFTLGTPLAQSACGAVGDMFFFGETALETIPAVITKLRPGPDLTCRVTMAPAPPEVWAYDTGTIPTLVSALSYNGPPTSEEPPMIGFIAVADSSTAKRVNDGTVIERISVSLSPIPVTNYPVTAIDAEYKHADANNWTTINRYQPSVTSFFITNVQAGETYDIRVRTVMDTKASEWTENSILVEGKSYAAGTCTGLTATSSGGGNEQFQQVTLSWTNPDDEDLWQVEIWRSNSNDRTTATAIGSVSDPVSVYTDTPLTNGATRYYWVRAVNTSGETGDWNAATDEGVVGTTRKLSAADYGDGSVGTQNIAENSVTYSEASYTADSISFGGAETTIQTVDITTTGRRVMVDVSFVINSRFDSGATDFATGKLRVYRDTSTLIFEQDICQRFYVLVTPAFNFTPISCVGLSFEDDPTADEHTYHATLQMSNYSKIESASSRSLRATEIKR
jgi:hypothetical protein